MWEAVEYDVYSFKILTKLTASFYKSKPVLSLVVPYSKTKKITNSLKI